MYEDEDWYEPDRDRWKHSGFGIASFVISLLAGLAEFVLLAIAGYLESTTEGGLDEDSPTAAVLGLAVIFGLLMCLVGGGLGIAGLTQYRRKKVFAILGLVFNAGVILGVITIVAIGLLMP